MQNKWLDNYGKKENPNDSKMTGPMGSMFSGYSDKGRNYSPAWGGQFQKGGKVKPLVVKSKDDPRYKAYRDSLTIYNRDKQLSQALKKYGYDEEVKSRDAEYFNKIISPQSRTGKLSTKVKGSNLNKILDFIPASTIDIPGEDYQYYSKDIVPKGTRYLTKWGIGEKTFNDDGTSSTSPVSFDKRLIFDYSNVNPRRQVIVRNPNAQKFKTVKTSDRTGYFEPVQTRIPLHAIDNINPIGIQSDFNISANPNIQIRPQARIPKYYNVRDVVNQPFGGSDTSYQYYPDRDDELSIVAPDNTRTITPVYRGGGVINDDMGQWAHPGKITRINSNNITMAGVPYNVLGISDNGDVKLMKPGGKYKFKGNKVTELPIAKQGSELVKLDQLTNFTNYNTPQPGGWLDNY
jgi:hypothetical protein